MTRRLARRGLLGGAAALALAPRVAFAEAGDIRVAYQAVPAADAGLPTLQRLDYGRLEMMAREVRRRIVPDVSAAVGLPDMAARTAIAPGGYRLRTDPSLMTSFDAEDRTMARLFAAAIGYVLRQEGVLVFADDARGDSLAVTLRLVDGAPEPALAHRFFRHAASVAPGLGGGYSSVGGDLVFINLRDGRGTPYSELPDDRFAAMLQRAAEVFAISVQWKGTKRVRAELIGAAWGKDAGAGFVDSLAGLPPAALSRLDLLGFTFAEMARDRFRGEGNR